MARWRGAVRAGGGFWPTKMESLLLEYGGLRIEPQPLIVSGVDYARSFGFDPLVPEFDLIEEYQEGTGVTLGPLGYIKGKTEYLASDDHGNVYVIAPEGLRSLGADPSEVLEKLVRNDWGQLEHPHKMDWPDTPGIAEYETTTKI